MSIRRKIGNFLSGWAWRLLHGQVDALAQEKAEKLQKSLRREFAEADTVLRDNFRKSLGAYASKVDFEALGTQLNFQPDLPKRWQEKVKLGDTYVDFENIFRDSKTIAERNKRYLPYFKGAGEVLDIGCGRGEFLELLKQNGIEGVGIDSSPEMIEACKKKDLKNVQVAEANAYLSSLPKSSQGGIFSCHVLEHLPMDDAMKFFPLAHTALKPGATLIIETPNPHSLPAFKLFWLDPTHVRPLFPEFLEWCARAGGFREVEILYLTEDGFSPTHGPWYGNYALMAHK